MSLEAHQFLKSEQRIKDNIYEGFVSGPYDNNKEGYRHHEQQCFWL